MIGSAQAEADAALAGRRARPGDRRRSWSSTASGARSSATPPRSTSAARATATPSPRTRSPSCCSRRSPAGVAERELQLYGPPRQVLQLPHVPAVRDGEVIGAVAFTRDVSEARRVESVRRDFVANVSHELKTPIGALGLLAETMAATDDVGVMRQLAERVVREADRLAQIVDDLLDSQQIEAQEAPTREPFPVALLVSRSGRPRAGRRRHGRRPAAGRAPAARRRDRVRPPPAARARSSTSLDNAIKYSEPGEPVEVGARLDGDRVALVVRDHGIGIPHA